MATAAETIAAINALEADEAAAFVTLFLNDGGAVVKNSRSRAFSNGKLAAKSETGAPDAATLAAEKKRADDAEAALEALRGTAPDVATAVAAEATKWKGKLDAATKRADDAEAADRAKDVDLTFSSFYAEVLRRAEDGTAVDPEWLTEDVARARFARQLAPKDGGGVRVLQLGSDEEYVAETPKEALRLLAADVRKVLPPRAILADVDNGGGVTNAGGAAGGGTGYDPVAAGKAMAKQGAPQAGTPNLAYT